MTENDKVRNMINALMNTRDWLQKTYPDDSMGFRAIETLITDVSGETLEILYDLTAGRTGAIVYPVIQWTKKSKTRVTGRARGYELEVHYWIKEDVWVALVNQRAVITGEGQYGYDFSSASAAQHAAKTMMVEDINLRVHHARDTLKEHTA